MSAFRPTLRRLPKRAAALSVAVLMATAQEKIKPHAIEKQAKFKPTDFPQSGCGWPPCSSTIACMERPVKTRPQAIAAFVKASMEGWKSFFKDAAAPPARAVPPGRAGALVHRLRFRVRP